MPLALPLALYGNYSFYYTEVRLGVMLMKAWFIYDTME